MGRHEPSTDESCRRVWSRSTVVSYQRWRTAKADATACGIWKIIRGRAGRGLLRGHEEIVNTCKITSDSRWLLTGSWDGNIRQWDLHSENPGSTSVLRGHEKAVLAVAISPDGRWVVTGSEDHTARLWDLRAENPARASIVLKHQDGVRSIAISPDSHWLVTSSGHINHLSPPASNEAYVWDLTADDPSLTRRVLAGHTGPVTYAMISPNSRQAVTLSYDGNALVWDLLNAASPPRVLPGHDKYVPAVAFSPDGQVVITGTIDGVVRTWDLSKQDPLEPFVALDNVDWVMGLDCDGKSIRAFTSGWEIGGQLWTLDLQSNGSPVSRALPGIRTHTPYSVQFHGPLMGLRGSVWDLSIPDPDSKSYSDATA